MLSMVPKSKTIRYMVTQTSLNYLIRASVFCFGNAGLGRSSLIMGKQNRNK